MTTVFYQYVTLSPPPPPPPPPSPYIINKQNKSKTRDILLTFGCGCARSHNVGVFVFFKCAWHGLLVCIDILYLDFMLHEQTKANRVYNY